MGGWPGICRITKGYEKAVGHDGYSHSKKWMHAFADFCETPLMSFNTFIVNYQSTVQGVHTNHSSFIVRHMAW